MRRVVACVCMIGISFGSACGMNAITEFSQVNKVVSEFANKPVEERRSYINQVIKDTFDTQKKVNKNVCIAILSKIDLKLRGGVPWITESVNKYINDMLVEPGEDEDVCNKYPDRFGLALLEASKEGDEIAANSDQDTVLRAASLLIMNAPEVFKEKMLDPMRRSVFSSYIPKQFN